MSKRAVGDSVCAASESAHLKSFRHCLRNSRGWLSSWGIGPCYNSKLRQWPRRIAWTISIHPISLRIVFWAKNWRWVAGKEGQCSESGCTKKCSLNICAFYWRHLIQCGMCAVLLEKTRFSRSPTLRVRLSFAPASRTKSKSHQILRKPSHRVVVTCFSTIMSDYWETLPSFPGGCPRDCETQPNNKSNQDISGQVFLPWNKDFGSWNQLPATQSIIHFQMEVYPSIINFNRIFPYPKNHWHLVLRYPYLWVRGRYLEPLREGSGPSGNIGRGTEVPHTDWQWLTTITSIILF